MRITDNVIAIFDQMLRPAGRPWYGLELAKATHIGSATIYAVLTRMERADLVNASWESHDPSDLGRPQRRLYTLTPTGIQVGTEAVANYRPRILVRSAGTPAALPGLRPSRGSV